MALPTITSLPLDVIRRRQVFERVEKVTAVVTAVAVGFRYDLTFDLRVGAVVAVVMLPLWVRAIPRYRFAALALLLMTLATASGALLTVIAGADHDVMPSASLSRASLVLGLAACTGALLWARSMVGSKTTALAFAVGLVASIPLGSGATDNPWRFVYSIPLTVLTLAAASYLARWWVDILCLVTLAVVGVLNDSRSNSSILFLAAVIIAWQAVSRSLFGRRRRTPVSIVGLGLLAVGVYFLVQSAILEGYFGTVTEARTEAQLSRSGSLLLGGRPEAAASFALIARYPWGLGSGVRADLADVMSAKTAMTGIGYDPNNGYVERFMFGTGIEVHSVLGDLWIWMGLFGALLAVVLLVLVVTGVRWQLQASVLTGLLAFLTLRYLWDFAFSPVATAFALLPLTLALALTERRAVLPHGVGAPVSAARHGVAT